MKKVKLPNWLYTIFRVMHRAFYIASIIFGVAIILGAVGLVLGIVYVFVKVALDSIQTTQIKDWLIGGGIVVTIGLGSLLISLAPKIVRWAWNKLLHGA